jgi:hypothetical protein
MANKFGSEFLVNTTTEELQSAPVVAGLTNGRFIVAWLDVSETGDDTSGSAVRVQVFHADGSRLGEEFVAPVTTSGNQAEPTITALADGRFVVAWRDDSMSGNDHDGNAVRAQIFNFDGSTSGPEAAACCAPAISASSRPNGRYGQPEISTWRSSGSVAWASHRGSPTQSSSVRCD